MASRHLLGGTIAVLLGTGSAIAALPSTPAPAVPASAVPAPAPKPVPVSAAVRLEYRPDVARAFGLDVAGFRVEAAAALSLTATERFGPISARTARTLGRAAYFRPQDVDLYAVPSSAGRADEAGRSVSFSVAAVPRGATVFPDGSVSPPAGATALSGTITAPTSSTIAGSANPAPRFSGTWGTEQFFTWAAYNVDDGGTWCANTYGRVRGQWEYARLGNVAPTSRYDYWGFASRSVAEITKPAKRCRNAIDWFSSKMQSQTIGAYPARQDPLSLPSGSCVSRTLSVGGSFGGVSASITQQVEKCETWTVTGALAPSALEFYGVEYDNNGVWNKLQREAGSLEILRVLRGSPHGLNTALGIDVDNR